MPRALRVLVVTAVGLVVWIAIGYASAQRACAHDPRFVCSPRDAANPVTIPDARKSWAFYGSLSPKQVDRFTFSLAQPAEVPWSLLVDVRDAANPARPSAVLYGAHSGSPNRATFDRATRFYEPFSREAYLQTPEQTLRLPAGSYSVVVTMRGGRHPQRYVMAIGRDERFSPLEIPYVLGAIGRIRALRY